MLILFESCLSIALFINVTFKMSLTIITIITVVLILTFRDKYMDLLLLSFDYQYV
jgi:hypothetical protein